MTTLPSAVIYIPMDDLMSRNICKQYCSQYLGFESTLSIPVNAAREEYGIVVIIDTGTLERTRDGSHGE
jgi:hypothetical protein